MLHIGHKISEVLKSRGLSSAEFADKICISRTHVYKIFEKQHLDTALLFRISRALDYDFFGDLSLEITADHGYVADTTDVPSEQHPDP